MLDEERRPSEEILGSLPVFPLPNAVLLPGMVMPLNVFEARYLDLVDHALARGGYLGLPLLCEGHQKDYDGEIPQQYRFRQVEVESLTEGSPRDPQLLEILKAQIERISATLDDDDAEMVSCVLRIPDPRILVYAITAIIPTLGILSMEDPSPNRRCPHLDLQQQCLGAASADERIHVLLDRSAAICNALGESGRFPRAMLN